jgi:hypothetical protein
MQQHWAILRTEMLGLFQHTDSQADSVVYSRHYLQHHCPILRNSFTGCDHAEFGGLDQTVYLKSCSRLYEHISTVITECGMTVEYRGTEVLLRALSKELWRMLILKLGLNKLEPRTFEYAKAKGWIAVRMVAAEASTMFDFLAHAALVLTTFPPLAISSASTASPTYIAASARLAPTASTCSTAPKSTLAFPVSPTPATPKTHTTAPALLVSLAPEASTASTACTVSLTFAVAEIPTTTATAKQWTTGPGPTVRRGMIRVESPPCPPVRRHHFVQRKQCQESALPNLQVPIQVECPQPILRSNLEPVPLNSEAVVQPPPCLHAVHPQ